MSSSAYVIRVMWKLFLVSTVLALLVYSTTGLVPAKFAPHEHLLIGLVTAAQLRAHEAAEAQQMQADAQLPASTSPAPGVTVTSTGGLIITVAPVAAGLISALHIEIALQLALLFFIPALFRPILSFHFFPQAVTLASPDPPPRPVFT